MIGAWVYYLKRATTNQERALGLAKGLVWPAFLVYALLAFLEDK
jgi:phage gp29-like protein